MAIKKFNSEAGFSVGNGLDKPIIDIINDDGNIVANALVVSNISNLGLIGNVKIAGGSNGQFIQTDGSGTLSFRTFTETPPGGTTGQIQFNNAGIFAGSSDFVIDTETGNVSANGFIGTFYGDGGNVSNIQGANVTGVVANANYAAYAAVTLNSTQSNTTTTVIGNAQPNITSIGNLTNLSVEGAIVANSTLIVAGDATFFGNVSIQGTAVIANVQSLSIKDPIIELGGNTTGTLLDEADGYNRGLVLHYYSNAVSQQVDAFMGFDTANDQFAFVSNAVINSNTVSIQTYGNVKANVFLGNGSGLTNILGASVVGDVPNAAYATNAGLSDNANYVLQPEQSAITSLGKLISLEVGNTTNFSTFGNGVISLTGNLTSGNANLGNAATANYFIGDGSLLANLSGANISEVANANYSTYAGQAIESQVVTDPEQTAITRVGILDSLVVAGNLTSGNANLGNVASANYIFGNGYYITGISGINVGQVEEANYALYAGNVTIASQPNITSLGTLTSLIVSNNGSGNIESDNANLGDYARANYFIGNGFYLQGIPGNRIVTEVANANYSTYSGLATNATTANTVTDNAQPNITSVGTLGTLTVSGNIAAGNANMGNLLEANFFSGNGYYLSNLNAPNVIGTVSNAYFATMAGTASFATTANRAATVTANNQPNITSVGTLSNLSVNDSILVGANITAFDTIQAPNIIGGNITITGTVSGALAASGGDNEIMFVSAGTISSDESFTYDPGNTELILNGKMFVSGNATVDGYIVQRGRVVPTFVAQANTPADPNLGDQWYDIDNDIIYTYVNDGVKSQWVDYSTGFLNSNINPIGNTLVIRDENGNIEATQLIATGADIDGSLTAKDTIITGNLTVSGTTLYTNVTSMNVIDPIIELGGGSNGNPLTSNDSKDRGSLLHYYAGSSAVDAFMGWDNSNSEFAFGSNVSVVNDVVSFNNFGNIRAGNANLGNAATANYFIGDGSGLTNIPATAVTPPLGNSVQLGMATDANLQNPGAITNWQTSTSVTDAIDDLNEVIENVRNNTYVKSVSFTASPLQGGAGTTVTLSITSVGNPTRYDITWGDGTQSLGVTSTSPTKLYSTNAGSPYTITVRAYNHNGSGAGSEASFTRAAYIVIYTADPVMSFGLYRASTGGTALVGNNLYVAEGETFYLENTTTNTSDASVTYTIDWGDSTTDTISSDSVAGGVGGGRISHVYASNQSSGTGTKTVRLTLTSHSTANPASIPRNTTTGLKVYDNEIAAPNGLSAKTISTSFTTTNTFLASGYTNNTPLAVTLVGTNINRTTANTGTIDTNVIGSYAYNADAGDLSVFLNDSEDSTQALTSADNSGTYGSLVITSEADYNLYTAAGVGTTFGSSIYKPNLYKGFLAKAAKQANVISVGLNSFQLRHSTTGNTNVVEFVKDDVTSTPTVDLTTATIGNGVNGTYRYISGIPYYNTGGPTVNLTGATIFDWIGQTYQNTATPFQIEAGTNDESTTGNVVTSQTRTYAVLDGAVTYLSSSIPVANTGKTSATPYAIGSQSIILTTSSVASVQTIKFRATNVNGNGAYATHSRKIQVFTASPSGFIEDNISVTSSSSLWNDAAKRIVISGATGATPAYNNATNYYTSSLWSGAQTIAGTDEAVVRWNQLKHFSADLSSYLPAGPDLATGRSGTQYFRGAFRRNAKSSITVTITGKISGLYIAAPGTSIDSASSINGWLDANLPYNGSGVPGANAMAGGTNGCAVGTVVPYGTVITNQTYTLTLGTVSTSNSTGNQILFSIALASGDYVTSWSFN
jgi:hypothetical protein